MGTLIVNIRNHMKKIWYDTKKRYFVVQLDRESDLISKLDAIKSIQPSTDNIELSLELSSNKKKRKKQLLYKSFLDLNGF